MKQTVHLSRSASSETGTIMWQHGFAARLFCGALHSVPVAVVSGLTRQEVWHNVVIRVSLESNERSADHGRGGDTLL